MAVVSGDPLGPSATGDVFQLLRDGVPRTRSELAAITGLARSTIAARIDALMAADLVRPIGDAVSTGGRPSARFALHAAARVVLAIDLGASHVRVGVADLSGRTLVDALIGIRIADGPDRILPLIVARATELLTGLGRSLADVVGVGVGVPAPVEHGTGRLTNPPIMPGWDRVEVGAALRDALGAPVLVDNDVNIMTLGERETSWPDADHLLFVKVATGIGSGIISGGLLQRGAQGTAGDIGHVFVARGAEVVCTCGNRGCLEAIASGPAIASALRGADAAGPVTSQDVVDLVRAGDVAAIRSVRQAGRDLGEVLSACVSLINPSVIVIGGAMAQAGEHLVAGVREVVYARATPLASARLTIETSRSGGDAGLIGASMLAIHHALAPERIDALAGLAGS